MDSRENLLSEDKKNQNPKQKVFFIQSIKYLGEEKRWDFFWTVLSFLTQSELTRRVLLK